jgi:hypothetical protein
MMFQQGLDTQVDSSEIAQTRALTSKIIEPKILQSFIDLATIEKLASQLNFKSSQFDPESFKFSIIRQNGIAKLSSEGNPEKVVRSILTQLKNPALIKFVSNILGARYYAADCQFHKMLPGSELVSHRHLLNDQHFLIFHFNHSYTGGQYFENINEQKIILDIPEYSLVINKPGVSHGVDTVLSGERIVMVTCWHQSFYKK